MLPPAKKRPRAFSLIEAAIVLGILGLVIGGIWVAAAAVHLNMKHANLQQGILQIQSALVSLYRNARPNSETVVNDVLLSRKAVPPDWISSNGLGLTLPLGGPTQVSVTDNQIIIRMVQSSSATCRRIFMEHAKYGPNTEWGVSVQDDYSGSEDIYLGNIPSPGDCNFPISGNVGTILILITY